MFSNDQVQALRAEMTRLQSRIAVLEALVASPDAGGPTPAAIGRILQHVAEDYGLTVRMLRGDWRRRDMVEARWVAMWIAREAFARPLVLIGRVMGQRDHTTVLHGVEKIKERRAADAEFRARTDRLAAELMTKEREA